VTVSDLPAINAGLNSCATVLLFLGWRAIKTDKREAHKRYMVGALATSALFLSCYLYYHYNAGAMTPYEKQGLLRYLYFAILITHIPLAALMTPFILAAVGFAFAGKFELHTRITRILWPVWMYVSVTGVIIYLMLYVF
jgi:uncharacterized membrane protein YozB (DUF420 family)